jgi:hypothetical protein
VFWEKPGILLQPAHLTAKSHCQMPAAGIVTQCHERPG